MSDDKYLNGRRDYEPNDDDNNDDDPPLSMATFDQIADELAKRSIGCVVACLVNMTPTEEHVYANFYGKTVAIGLCNRILHNILHEPSPNVHDDAG